MMIIFNYKYILYEYIDNQLRRNHKGFKFGCPTLHGEIVMALNPRVDFAFKKLFGTEENKDILIAFINAIVAEEDRVKDVVLIDPYNHQHHAGDKLSILDIEATDEKGRQYNIEMQVTDEVYYNQRALYYWSRLYSSQLVERDEYDELKKTISINILNFDYFIDEVDYHNIFHLLNAKSHKRCFEDLELHFIELEKFDRDLKFLKTALDRWTSFLKRAGIYKAKDLPPELSIDPKIDKAMRVLDTMALNQEERQIYEAKLK